MSVNESNQVSSEKKLSTFEKYLPLWIGICMAAGIVLSQVVPGIGEAIDSWQIAGISIPIGICLFLMMYPAMLNIQGSELKKLGRNPKPIILTLISNWIVAPIVGYLLARAFLAGYEQLIVAVILLSSSPCTAMVLVWGYLAEGNQEQNVVNTTLNTATILVLYAPIVAILTGLSNIPIDRVLLVISVTFFIGAPLLLGLVTRRILVNRKGKDWFKNKYQPAVGKLALIALLTTLIVLFSLNGAVMLEHPDLLVLVSIPLLLGFVIVVGYNIMITRLVKMAYKESTITVIIGSSSHFEIAIATAISIYGVGSIAALGTTMGLFWEVPIMLGLVYLSKYLRKKEFWKGRPM
ncbi:ACR3 family arsenite efflux transporter [Candidatus Thorarchaeota archaeon]|nr:MAG: ACR3 family arsenite efflux transporter [Candidatus Thorarchaeota archaeon]